MRLSAYVVALLCAALLAASPVRAQGDGFKSFVDRLIAASSALLRTENTGPQCKALIAWAYDIPGIARMAAGDAWSKASAQERTAYQAAFEQAAVNGCAKFSANERGALLTFAGMRAAENGDQLAAVRVEAQGRNERTWIWRVRSAGGAYRVTDVIVDGASMLATERREISQVLANDGSLPAATEYLRKRSAQ